MNRLYLASSIPGVDVAAIAYFAASIFWRASIHDWKGDGVGSVRLGPFADAFRLYLLSNEEFPADAALIVFVRANSMVSGLCRLPLKHRLEGLHTYSFVMPGFMFRILVSKNLTRSQREMCFVRGHGNPLVVTNELERALFDAARKTLNRSGGV